MIDFGSVLIVGGNMYLGQLLRRQQAAEPDATPEAPTPTEALLVEIRDELRARK